MRAPLFLCALLILLLTLPAQAQQADTSKVEAPELRRELLAMRDTDQEIREELSRLFRSSEGQPDMQTFMRMKIRLDSLDGVHARRVEAIIEKHGWPEPTLVGRDGIDAAFLIVQHADLALQKKALPLVRKAYQKGDIDGQSLALLTDRVHVSEGKPQLYGTQANIQNGEITFDPIRDSTHVDERRAALGLPPLSEYTEQMKALYMLQQGNK
jgi:hypothetical protein